jgi:hypothetical protein
MGNQYMAVIYTIRGLDLLRYWRLCNPHWLTSDQSIMPAAVVEIRAKNIYQRLFSREGWTTDALSLS